MKKAMSRLLIGALVFGLFSPAGIMPAKAEKPDTELQTGEYFIQFKDAEQGKKTLEKKKQAD